MRADLMQKRFFVLSLAIVGATLGAAIMLYNSASTPKGRGLIATPEFLVWLSLILLSTILCAVLAVPLWSTLSSLRREFHEDLLESRRRLDTVVGCALLFFLLFLPTSIPSLSEHLWRLEFPLPHQRLRMNILLAVGFFTVLLPASMGIWLVQSVCRGKFKGSKSGDSCFRAYFSLRGYLQRFLSALGLVIGVLTLATGASRKTLIAAQATSIEGYPSEIVLSYGAYYTLVLALLYIPAYFVLLGAGRRLQDIVAPVPDLGSSTWADTFEKRKKLEEILQLRTGVQQNLQASVAILAPLLGSVVTTLLS